MKAQRFTAILFIFIIGVLCLVSAPAVPRILTYRDTGFQGVLGDRGQGSRLDSGLSKEFPALTFWMGVYGEVNKTLGIRYIPDQEVGVAKLDGGQLSYGIDRLGDKRLDELWKTPLHSRRGWSPGASLWFTFRFRLRQGWKVVWRRVVQTTATSIATGL